MLERRRPARARIALAALDLPAATVLAWASLGHVALAQGNTTEQAVSREELQRLLQERDAVIVDLLNRVRDLETRLPSGTAAAPSPSAQQAGPAEAGTSSAQARPAPAPAPQRSAGQAAPAPASTPGQLVVDPQAAERALERTLVQTGALLLPVGQVEVSPRISYTQSDDAAPFLVTDQGGNAFAAESRNKRNTFEFGLDLRVGMPFDSQLELSLPYTYVDESDIVTIQGAAIEQSNLDGSGFSGLEVGFAKTLLRERAWLPDLVGRAAWHTATGENNDNGVFLGNDFNSFTVGLSASKSQDPLVFVFGADREWTLEKNDIKLGAQTSLSVGTFLAVSPETSLRFGFDQTFKEEDRVNGRKIDGSETSSGSLVLGASILLGPRALLDVSGSVGVTEDASDFAVTVAIPIRFNLPIP